MSARATRRRLLGASALLVAALLGTSCSSTPASLPARVRAWASNAGYSDDVSQIESDLGDLANGLRQRALPQLRTACEGFGVDVETLYGELPTPDHALTDQLGAALSGMYTASRECYDSPSFSSREFGRYRAQLARSLVGYDQALRRFKADGVR